MCRPGTQMTLLLGTIDSAEITLSADGMSLVKRNCPRGRKHQGTGRMTLQKIMQVANYNIAIAHYGTNGLKLKDGPKRSVMQLLGEWTQGDLKGNVAFLADHIGEQIRRLVKSPSELEGGLWVCGFD